VIDLSRPEILFAIGVVEQASRLAREVRAGMEVQGVTKGDLSPVTVADFAVQALVGRGLGTAFPEATLVGEESAAVLREPGEAALLETITGFVSRYTGGATGDDVCAWIDRGTAAPGERFWTLDPIDGTKGYLRGGQYAIALALIEAGRPVLGVLGCPNLGAGCDPAGGGGVIAVAAAGEGTWMRVLDTADGFSPLRVSACSDARQARVLRSYESGHTNVDQVDEIAARLGIEAQSVGLDSQAKYAVLASGGGELLFRLLSPKRPDYREMIWDQAAGAIVLEEAGGRITDLSGAPLDFSQGKTLARNKGVFASNGPLHDAGLAAIAAVCG